MPESTVKCPRCDAQWGGLSTCHCSVCHEAFTSIHAFDKHRTGSHSRSTRACLPPGDVGLIHADRAYPCWRMPGQDTRWASA